MTRFLASALLGVVLVLLGSCGKGNRVEFARVSSPSSSLDAVAYKVHAGGATVPMVFEIVLEGAAGSERAHQLVFEGYRLSRLCISWVSDDTLLIQYQGQRILEFSNIARIGNAFFTIQLRYLMDEEPENCTSIIQSER